MKSVLDLAKSYLIDSVPEDGIVADFTMGNGNDTLFLSSLVSKGHVYAFDIQPQALENTKKKLAEHGARDNVTLILDSHSELDRYLPESFDGGLFNLGYLPWSDKSITTKHETTLTAIEKAVARLRKGRAIVIVIYPGHPEGALEGREIEAYAKRLPKKEFDATVFRIVNVEDCPYFVAIEKRD